MARTPALTSQMQYGRVIPGLNLQAFRDLISDWGVLLVHYRAVPCPIGQVDQYDPRKPHHAHAGCENGFIFDLAGEVTCLFQGNGTQTQIYDTGQYVGSTVNITFPPTYDDSEVPVTVAPSDRLVLKEHRGYVVANQRFKAADTGVDALQFPIQKIEVLIDSNGARYTESDFDIIGGAIHWKDAHRPAPGSICSVRYLYVPYWYVGKLVHEIRVAPTQDPLTGVREIERWPYSALCHRENFARDGAADPTDSLKAREQQSPDSTESELLA